jgi:hypothetical protein
MADVRVDEALWASSILPEGIVERWFLADGAIVAGAIASGMERCDFRRRRAAAHLIGLQNDQRVCP